MKKLYFTAILLVLGCVAAFGADSYRFGYCDNTKSLGDKMISLNGSMSLEAAVHFPAEQLERFAADGTIDGINIGMANKFNVASVKAWLRDALTGEDIATCELSSSTTPSLEKGWNEARFAEPVRIEAGHDYYAGYTLTLKTASSAALICSQTGSHDGGCWIKVGDGEWADRSSEFGILNLELLITSENLPQHDLMLVKASILSDYIVPGQGVEVEYSIRNVGMKPASSYVLTLADKEAGVSATKVVESELEHDARITETAIFDVPGLQPEHLYNFTLTISGPEGWTEETPGDNVATIPEITAINSTYERVVLIEEFTTEKCSNCPAAAKNLHMMYDTLSESDKKRVAIVCHHTGAGNDSFTQPCDNAYHFFYGNGGSTFAPGFMFDRVKKAERGIPVMGPQSANGLKNYFMIAKAEEAFYSINVTGSLDETSRTVTLDIAGKAAARIFDNPRITVYLTEDDVKPVNQTNAGVDFMHNHVVRAYNSTWGVAPTWTDDFNYTSKAKLSYSAGCKSDNMEIVALISNYNSADYNDCEVGNAFKVKLRDLKPSDPSSVNTVDSDADVRVYQNGGRIVASSACEALEVYDLNGKACVNENLAPGIYVVRVTTAATTAVRKIMVR